jgi:hypothetical protein
MRKLDFGLELLHLSLVTYRAYELRGLSFETLGIRFCIRLGRDGMLLR